MNWRMFQAVASEVAEDALEFFANFLTRHTVCLAAIFVFDVCKMLCVRYAFVAASIAPSDLVVTLTASPSEYDSNDIEISAR